RDLVAERERQARVLRPVGRDVGTVRAKPDVEREAAGRAPLVLQEQADVVRRDIACRVVATRVVPAVGPAIGLAGRRRLEHLVPVELNVEELLSSADAVAEALVL